MEYHLTQRDQAFTPGVGAVLKTAFWMATRDGREGILPEHLLGALVVRTDRAAAALFKVLAPSSVLVKDGTGAAPLVSEPVPFEAIARPMSFEAAMALEYALQEMTTLGHEVLSTTHLVAALAALKHPVGQLLRSTGVTPAAVRDLLETRWAEFWA